MKLLTISFLSLISVNAFSADQFCASIAAEAAKAVANVNGSVSEVLVSSQSNDGKVFTVILQEKNIGEDTYYVTTSGGHDCVVYSVKVEGQPTHRP